MATPTSAPDPTPSTSAPRTPLSSYTDSTSTPGRCLWGAAISSGLGFVLYLLTMAIIHSLAKVPIPNKSAFSANIAVAVRTLVIGVSTMATALFAFAALGLIALAIQLWIQQRRHPSA